MMRPGAGLAAATAPTGLSGPRRWHPLVPTGLGRALHQEFGRASAECGRLFHESSFLKALGKAPAPLSCSTGSRGDAAFSQRQEQQACRRHKHIEGGDIEYKANQSGRLRWTREGLKRRARGANGTLLSSSFIFPLNITKRDAWRGP